jgi:hypothetical protein
VIATGVRQATAQDGEMEFSRSICICVYFFSFGILLSAYYVGLDEIMMK